MISQAQTVDVLLELEDGGAAFTADRAGQVASSDVILDLVPGGRPLDADLDRQAEVHGNMHVDVSAIDLADNDEEYRVLLQGSTEADFASTIVNLAVLSLSALEVALGGGDQDSAVGRHVVPFSNELNGTTFRHVRLFVDVNGTSPSITLTARLHKQD